MKKDKPVKEKKVKKAKKDKSVIDLNKVRKKLATKKVFRLLKIPVVILVFIMAIFLSARLLGNVATSNATDAIRAIPSLFSRSGSFPYDADSLNFRKADLIGNDLVIITTDSAKVISSAVKEREICQLDSADSKVITENGRALIFSNSSGKVSLHSKTEKLGSIDVGATVNTVALADNGYFAVTYPSDKAQSVIEVRNSRFKKVFQWNCSKEFISAIGLSDNGRSVALAAISSQNAEIYSRLLVFSTKSTSPSVDLRFDGTTLLKVVFTSTDKIIAIGDNKTVIIDKKGNVISEENYSESSLVASDSDDNGNTVLCYREFGGSKFRLIRYSAYGKATCNTTVDYSPDAISIRGSRFAVSSGSEIRTYSTKGEELKTISAENHIKSLLLSPNNIYTVEGNSICKY